VTDSVTGLLCVHFKDIFQPISEQCLAFFFKLIIINTIYLYESKGEGKVIPVQAVEALSVVRC
jgi:hypothetical protein